MSLVLKNISKIIGKKKIISKINFEAKAGDIVGILGPNGAGKSTLMKTIIGIYTQDSGRIDVFGNDTVSNKILTKSMIGYLSEDNPLYKDMTVNEFLKFVCDLHKITQSACDKIMKLTYLLDVKNQTIKTLSKGYRQRVGIAQALIHEPKIIILDEPTSGLDPKQLVEIRKIITNLGKDKIVIVSSHIIQEIEEICNRIIILNNGEILADKKISDFDGNLANKFLKLIDT
jgi:ABC-2 type transport system ATP-binding protein